MRLSYKLSLGVGLALAVALGIDSYIEVQRSVSEYESDLLNHTSQQAHTLSVSVSKLWTSYGDGGAIEVIGAADSASPDRQRHAASWPEDGALALDDAVQAASFKSRGFGAECAINTGIYSDPS